jgi:hypothetical protein
MYGFDYIRFRKTLDEKERKERAKPTVERKGTTNEKKYNEYVKTVQSGPSFKNKKPK